MYYQTIADVLISSTRRSVTRIKHSCQAVKSNFGLNVRKVKQRASAAGIKTYILTELRA